jgi:hypothetical protein
VIRLTRTEDNAAIAACGQAAFKLDRWLDVVTLQRLL